MLLITPTTPVHHHQSRRYVDSLVSVVVVAVDCSFFTSIWFILFFTAQDAAWLHSMISALQQGNSSSSSSSPSSSSAFYCQVVFPQSISVASVAHAKGIAATSPLSHQHTGINNNNSSNNNNTNNARRLLGLQPGSCFVIYPPHYWYAFIHSFAFSL